MSNNQKDKQVEQAVSVAANSAALDCFNMAKTKAALEHISDAKSTEDSAMGDRISRSMELSLIAEQYHVDCAEITQDHSLVMGDLRDNWKLVLATFAAAKHPFVIITPSNKEGEADHVKWNTTAGNAISTAKGVVDFAVVTSECLNDKGENTWTAVQKEVQRLRKERRDEENPEAALLALAKTEANEAFLALCKVVFATGDIGLIEALTNTLGQMKELSIEEIAKQTALDKVAKAAADAQKALEAQASEDEELTEIDEQDETGEEVAVAA